MPFACSDPQTRFSDKLAVIADAFCDASISAIRSSIFLAAWVILEFFLAGFDWCRYARAGAGLAWDDLRHSFASPVTAPIWLTLAHGSPLEGADGWVLGGLLDVVATRGAQATLTASGKFPKGLYITLVM